MNSVHHLKTQMEIQSVGINFTWPCNIFWTHKIRPDGPIDPYGPQKFYDKYGLLWTITVMIFAEIQVGRPKNYYFQTLLLNPNIRLN